MRLEIEKYIFDIIDSINSIYEYLEDKRDFSVYESNKQLRRAVERELEIIGEATNKILKLEPDFPLSQARRVVDLRNWVIHGYDRVDDVIVWGILMKDIPKLKSEVEAFLKV